MKKIIPAILTDKPQELKHRAGVMAGVCDDLHIDIMDGRFVKPVSIPISELKGVSENFAITVHLMVENPQKYIAQCFEVGVKRVIFQLEGTDFPREVISQIKAAKMQAGMAIKAETSITRILEISEEVDEILLLAVEAGYGGQVFQESVLDKLAQVRKLKPTAFVTVDGGINLNNFQEILTKGASAVVVGSAIFKSADPVAEFQKFKNYE